MTTDERAQVAASALSVIPANDMPIADLYRVDDAQRIIAAAIRDAVIAALDAHARHFAALHARELELGHPQLAEGYRNAALYLETMKETP